MSGPPLLGLEGVGRTFVDGDRRVEVLDHVDLGIRPGEFLLVTGPSGSGKSTLLHIAALLDRPSRGRVVFQGRDLAGVGEGELCRVRARHLGIVFQRYALLPHRSALDNVMFRFRYLPDYPHDRREAAREALQRVHLDGIAGRRARLLSGGEMQRVAIARAIAARPDILVADEPTGNLDGEAAARVMQVFTELNRAGLAIVMVTHNLELLRYGSRHVELRQGSLAPGSR